MSKRLIVNEIFFSIQGESSYTGQPCAFLRLAHCNLRCTYCDTEYAFNKGQSMPISEIKKKLNTYPTDLIEITGGEPLLQKEVLPLITELLDEGKRILIETGGSIDICEVDLRAVLIYDIKCPTSNMSESNRWENLVHLKKQDEVKFVIGSRQDYDWAKTVIDRFSLDKKHVILLSPVWNKLSPSLLAEWMLLDGLSARLQLQLHKILWGPETRGV